jgi:RNA polymerase sigma-70 factor (ECF subfamily)
MAAERTDGPAPPPGPEHGAGQVTPLSLLDRVRANDPEAWRRLVGLYRPLVLHWCARAGAHGADAEDVAQEVFAAAAAGLTGFRRDRPGDTFRGWMRGITRNQALLYFRRKGRQPVAEGGAEAWQRLLDVASPRGGSDPEETIEVGRLYRRALELVQAEFEERTWQAFWLTAIEGRAPADLAEELGMTAAGIRQAKSRVLRRLREEAGDLLG